MGGGFSKESGGNDEAGLRRRTGLGDLPESCVALILACLDPPEICRLAGLNRVFRRASSADLIWESKLPENYEVLVKRLLGDGGGGLGKREIYSRLCRPISIDGGNKEIWMEKDGGGMCASISWKGLKITGIDDRRYWTHIPTDESRFKTIAYLQQIWWLEVDGDFQLELPRGNYTLFFRLRLGKSPARLGLRRRRSLHLDGVHGWQIKPVRFHMSPSTGHKTVSEYFLKETGDWILYKAGDFVVENSKLPTKIKFSMTQIDCTHTKGGLCLDSALIYPADLGEKMKQELMRDH